jgi:hemoglobin
MIAQVSRPTLFDQLGGNDSITAVVGDFYGRVLADDTLRSLFTGVDLDRLRRHQAKFIGYALGGPNQYKGRTIRAAHADLAITETQFAAVAGHLAASLSAFDVPLHLIDQVIQHVAQLKDEVVTR